MYVSMTSNSFVNPVLTFNVAVHKSVGKARFRTCSGPVPVENSILTVSRNGTIGNNRAKVVFLDYFSYSYPGGITKECNNTVLSKDVFIYVFIIYLIANTQKKGYSKYPVTNR